MRLFAFVLSLALLSFTAHAEEINGTAVFQAASTSGLVKIDGEGATVTGSVSVVDGKASGTIEADLSKVTTGMGLRDKHMHEKYLATHKTAKASLKLTSATPSAEFDWSGELTLKGETKPVHGKAKFNGDSLWAEFTFPLTDFPAIGVPEWAGVTVAKDVTVRVNAKVKK